MGFVKMVFEIGKYFGELKDMVCLFGGIIIEVVKVFEEEGFRVFVIKVICVCIEKFKKMSE